MEWIEGRANQGDDGSAPGGNIGGFGQQQQFQLGKSAAAKNNIDDDDGDEEAAEKKA